MSRQQLSHNNSDSPEDSPIRPGPISEQPSSSSEPHHISEGSEGYPSWLPKRPPPPPPASTFHSSHMDGEPGPSERPFIGGRKPTPRSVRIVSLQDSSYGDKDRPAEQTRVSNPLHPRVWSRATAAAMSPAVFSDSNPNQLPQLRFRSKGLHLELLRNPSPKSRLYFYLYPLFVFAHIPLQTFFDFNAVFILFQVIKFPNPEAPGVPGSGRNWTLGAAAYIASWLVWILVVCVVYEIVYSFSRRWRIKRPLVLPIYLSSPAFNLVAMTSYTNFCFLQHIRYTAFFGEYGSIRDGLAETFWFYSQNLPTVALLLPRAGLALALLLSFSSPQPGVVALADAGIRHRDATFFRLDDGTLTNYARGVLIANAAWTAWRVLVLWCSWIGLWIVSGQGCAGLCGPRYRWEEEEAEKTMSVYSDAAPQYDALPWSWKECTRVRIQEAYDFCLTVRPSARWNHGKKEVAASELLGPSSPTSAAPFEGMEQVLAAVGFPSVPPPARRGVLSEDLFESPKGDLSAPGTAIPAELSAIIPKVAKRSSKDKQVAGPSSPLMALPYPFTAQGAQLSSQDRVPFPPSPVPSGEKGRVESSGSGSGEEEEESDEDDEEDEDDDEDEEVEDTGVEGSEEPSSGRASGSMSSLGQPVSSRYPFQFRRPARGNSMSSGAASHISPQSKNTHSSNTRSMQSQSTGNRESSDSQSPRPISHYSDAASPASQSSGIPMPPRHPQQAQGRGRPRAGTVPAAVIPSSPTPVMFPRGGRPRARTRTASSVTEAFGGPGPPMSGSDDEEVGGSDEEGMVDQPEPEGSTEAAEREDIVGLLSRSAAPSPKSSFTAMRHRTNSTLSNPRRGHGSRSGSNSRTNSQHSGSSSSRSRAGSISISVRSRAQSLMQSVGAASHSSLELVQSAIRSRANSSMARLEEDVRYYSDGRTHSRSGSGSDALMSGSENNHTFGHPLRTGWRGEDGEGVEGREREPAIPESPTRAESGLRESRSGLSVAAPSQGPSERTVSPVVFHDAEEAPEYERGGMPIPARGSSRRESGMGSSHPDISTAAQSFVTAPATVEGTTDSSGRTLSSWGGISHMADRTGGTWRPA